MCGTRYNLVSNAVKYGTPYSTIVIKLSASEDAVKIQINNSGDPISSEDQLTLFNQFNRSKSAEKKDKGWGIGLALVKALVEAHHGTVSVHSTEEEGTTFTVEMPKDSRKF